MRLQEETSRAPRQPGDLPCSQDQTIQSDAPCPTDRPALTATLTAQEAYQFHASANFLFSVLNDAGDRFDQDYTAFVVYCAFLVAAAADTLRDVTSRKPRAGYAPGILSAHSLAAMTGVPRETVRRRCLQLVERGLIERHSAGQFRCNVTSAEANALIRQFQQVQPFR